MGTRNSSTVANRVMVVGQLLSRQGEYGVVTGLSRAVGVARQTLYTLAGAWAGSLRAGVRAARGSPVGG